MQQLLRNICISQKNERDNLLTLPSQLRTLTDTIRKSLSSSLIKVITGPRRVGKSTLAFQCLKGTNFGYLNFEDNSLPREVDTDALMEVVDDIYDSPERLLFDEIQLLPRWEQFLNKLHRRGRNLVITGSNSALLSGELASSLTGRHIAFELLPFSFLEFLDRPQAISTGVTDDHDILTQHYFDRFWERGGFPEIALGSEEPTAYLGKLVDSIVLRDIVHRFRLRNPRGIAALLELSMSGVASRFSAHNLSTSLAEPKLSVATVLKYLSMARDAYLLFELQPFFAKPRKRMKADRKMYAVDHAMARSCSTGVSENRGATLENIVFIELVRRGHVPNTKLFYLQTKHGREVDFLIRHSPHEVELLQVSYELQSLKTRERELKGLIEGARETGAKKLTIVTYRGEERIEQEGFSISVVPAYRWLRADSDT